MVQSKTTKEKPIFRIRSSFYPLVIFYAHPVRVCAAFFISLFMLPELARLFTWITDIEGFLSYILSGSVVFLLALWGPLIMTWLDYRVVIYSFYGDRVEFILGFWVREKLSIPYHGITEVIPRVNRVQKTYKLGNVILVAEPRIGSAKNRQQGHELPDIRNPEKIVANLQKLLKVYRKKQQLERQV